MNVILIDRENLQAIRDEAIGMATGNLNPDWVRAYLNLADAADRLDAMQARCEIISHYDKDKEPKPKKSSMPSYEHSPMKAQVI